MRIPRRRNQARVSWKSAAQAGASAAPRTSAYVSRVASSIAMCRYLPADTTGPAAPVAMDAMPNAGHAAQTFQVDVEQIADVGPFRAVDRRRGLDEGDAIKPAARQDASDGRPKHPQCGADLPGRDTGPQCDDGGFHPRRAPSRLVVRARRAIEDGIVAAAGDPLGDGAHAQAQRVGNPRVGPAEPKWQ
jgi:hypothetical protein